MRPAVSPDEIAALTKQLAETAHAARVIRLKLEHAKGPLAVLAGMRMQHIEDAMDTAFEGIREAAPIFVAVTIED